MACQHSSTMAHTLRCGAYLRSDTAATPRVCVREKGVGWEDECKESDGKTKLRDIAVITQHFLRFDRFEPGSSQDFVEQIEIADSFVRAGEYACRERERERRRITGERGRRGHSQQTAERRTTQAPDKKNLYASRPL